MAGVRVVTGEQHGLSQRSGSVSIHLRMGESAMSPLIPVGTAEVILSLEGLEALRYIEYLREGGTVLANSLVMHPVTETDGIVRKDRKSYTGIEDVDSRMKEVASRVIRMDARGIASSLGSPLAENMVMLGALSALEGFPLERIDLEKAAGVVSPAALAGVNIAAVGRGATLHLE
jgi:indolepyruvate ferredoxin oxidoreductase beta subunit